MSKGPEPKGVNWKKYREADYWKNLEKRKRKEGHEQYREKTAESIREAGG